MTEWLLLATSVLLVIGCGLFVAAEFSFVTVDRASVDAAAASGDVKARGVAKALKHLSTQLSGAQLGITVTNLAIGFLAEPAIAELIRDPLSSLGVRDAAVTPLALAIALGLSTVATMVFGELVPKNLAIAKPLPVAKTTQGFQRGFTRTMAIPIRFMNGSANAILRRVGVEPQEELSSARSPEELSYLVRRSALQGTLDADTARLMERTLMFGGRTAADIMIPRPRMVSVEKYDSVAEVIDLARQTGHSRFPVVYKSADAVVGAVHVKHAVAIPAEQRHSTRVSQVMVEATSAPESLELDPLLTLLRNEGLQLAVVVDEYGGTAGVVTLEDVLEEIVGEIADEHDPQGTGARRRPDDAWSVSGLLRPDEVAEQTGVELPEDEDYDTVAGLFLQRFGAIPRDGDSVMVELAMTTEAPDLDELGDDEPTLTSQARLTVERMDGLRIDRIVITLVDADE